MACEIATAPNSPFQDKSFDESWADKNPETTDLSSMPDFDNLWASDPTDNASIEPSVVSNPASPASTMTAFNTGGVDATLSPEPSNTGLGLDSDDFNTQRSSPYFTPLPPAPAFSPAAARYQTRQRSVSEPPADFMHLQNQQAAPPVQLTFHRNGHWLGHPDAHRRRQNQQAKVLKSLPKTKREQLRSTPYNQAARNAGAPDQQQRYHLRRAQTQPVRPPMAAPTSAPTALPPPPQHGQHMMTHTQSMHGGPIFEPLPAVMETGQHVMSSRVCTPTPDPSPRPQSMMMPSPVLFQQQQPMIDPQLMGATVGSGTGTTNGMAVPVSVEELRRMITEAVEKAVKGLEVRPGEVVETVEGRAEDVQGENNGSTDADHANNVKLVDGEGPDMSCEDMIKVERDDTQPKHPDDMTLDELLCPDAVA